MDENYYNHQIQDDCTHNDEYGLIFSDWENIDKEDSE
jgi:hypothetical protein